MTVERPVMLEKQRPVDFGPGFYTTTHREQAEEFARSVVNRRKFPRPGIPTLNIYEFDDDAWNSLEVKDFKGVNEEWLDFVTAHRLCKYTGKQYDVVIGPIANDNVFRTLQLYD
ncbi:MAG: DUF3990 domain-containing protein [Clostridia bacterium]|nr:DUF3990 domain-containing protein [Clostridia bacterium]